MKKKLNMFLFNIWKRGVLTRLQGDPHCQLYFILKAEEYRLIIERGGTMRNIRQHVNRCNEELIADMQAVIMRLRNDI